MSLSVEEVILTMPAELTSKCQGLALDMGGSTLKFVFRTKEDVDEINSNPGKKFSRLHLVTLGHDDLLRGLNYVKQRAYLQTGDSDEGNSQAIYTTGFGCTAHGKLIRETLNIKLQNLSEMDCFAKSLYYLATHLPRKELLEPFNDDAVVEPLEYSRSQLAAAADCQDKTAGFDVSLAAAFSQQLALMTGRSAGEGTEASADVSLAEAESDVFPCLQVVCGSAFGWMKIEEDGTFKLIDGSTRGGRAFWSIGSILTGCKDFEELIQLAASGDNRRVDQYTSDVILADQEDDSFYKSFTDMVPGLLFSFGKMLGQKDGFRREDMARAWLNYVILDLTQCVHSACLVHEVKRVFFCGGFCSSPLVRQVITTEMARRNMFTSMLSQKDRVVTFDFVKPGQHLGALGCLVNNVEKFLK